MTRDEAETVHERAHAGLSDPDACDRGAHCPMAVCSCGDRAPAGEVVGGVLHGEYRCVSLEVE